MILLAVVNIFGVKLGALIQNIFTSAKALSLAALILLAFTVGRNATAWEANFGAGWSEFWRNAGWSSLHPVQVGVGGPMVLVNLLVILAVVQVGSLFSADAWNNITFTAGEVKNPRRNIPLSLILGTGFVLTVYFLVSLGYLLVLPMHGDPNGATVLARGHSICGRGSRGDGGAGADLPLRRRVPDGRRRFWSRRSAAPMECTLAGARVYYAMSQDGLFFKSVGKLHPRYKTPAAGLLVQARVDRQCCASPVRTASCSTTSSLRCWSFTSSPSRLVRAALQAARRAAALQGAGLSGASRALYRDGGVDLYRIIAIQAPVHVAGTGAGFARNSGLSILVAAGRTQGSSEATQILQPI